MRNKISRYIKKSIVIFGSIGLVVPTSVYAKSLSLTYGSKDYTYTGKQLKVKWNEKNVLSSKTPGIIENNVGLVPYNVFQQDTLGIQASYNKKTKKISFQYGDKKILVKVGSKKIENNGKIDTLPVAPKFVRYNDSKVTKLLVPSRKVAETLGLEYSYESSKATIIIKSQNKVIAKEEAENSTITELGRKVEYNGNVVQITKPDVAVKTEENILKLAMPGLIIDNTAMLPAYSVFAQNTQLGTTYKFEQEKQRGTITGNGNRIVFTIGQNQIEYNGRKMTLRNKILMVKNINNSKVYCMIPGQEIAQLLGFEYQWDNKNVMSIIKKQAQKIEEVGTETKVDMETVKEEMTQKDDENVEQGAGDISHNTVKDEIPNNTIKEETLNFAKDVVTPNIEVGVLASEIQIKRPSPNIQWSMCSLQDDYHNRRWIITLQGDYESFYQVNPIVYHSQEIKNIQVERNLEGNTEIRIETTEVKGIYCNETEETWEIQMKKPKDLYSKIVVLDAGHGGKDSGAVSSFGVIEKDVALRLIESAKDYFDTDNSIKVYYTRLSDEQENITYGNTVSSTTTSVVNRANFANEVGADLFLSVHCNSAANQTARGTEILYSSKNTIVKENGLTSKVFAETAFPILLEAVGSTKRAVKDFPNLIVCRNSQMPAILLEIAFVSNNEDAAILQDDSAIHKIGKGIYDIITTTFQKYPTQR